MSDETTVKRQIQDQMKQAMKAGEKARLGTLRLILSEIDAAVALDPEADQLAVVRSFQKKLVKAKAEYEKAAIVEQVEQLDREIAVVEEFLPAQMSDVELENVVERIVNEHNFGQKDFGRAMKEIMGQVGDRVDGGRASAILKAKLAAHS